MRKPTLLILLILAAIQTPAAQADKVYRYTDAQGVVHYSDKPPVKDARPADLPQLQTFPSGGKADLSSVKQPRKAAAQFGVTINSPQPEETLRDAVTEVPVSVTVTPALTTGYGLVYTMDGQNQSGTTASTSFTVSGLERGSHTIGVAVVDESGQQVASSSVTVNMKQPVARAK